MAGMLRRTMVYLGLQDDEDEYEYDPYATNEEYYGDADPAPTPGGGSESRRSESRPEGIAAVRPVRDPTRREVGDAGEPDVAPSAVTARPSVVRTVPVSSARVHIVEPGGFNDAQEVGDRLRADQPVILNLQGLGRDLQRRLIDFSSGLAYAVGGTMARVADQVFLLTPSDVEVSQEEKERLQARGLYKTS